jgi:signal transduction histidine kinase
MYALDREREELLRELGILNRVSKALNSELQVESLLDLLLRTLTEELGYDGATVLLFDPRRERLKVARCAPSEGEVAEGLAEIAIPCEQARDFVRRLDKGEIQSWSSEDLLELGAPVRRLATEIAAEEMLVVPLVGSSGAIAAVAIDNRRGGRAFTSSDRTLLGGLAAQAAISLHNASLVEDLSRARQRMLRADRMGTLGMLAAGLPKEIEGPLDTVRSFLQSAGRRRGEEAFWQQDHARACRELDQLREVVETAGRLARGSGEEESPEVLEIGEVIEEALALLAPEAQAARVALAAERGAALPNLFVRRDRLHQLVLNALSRAVRRSSPDGRVTLRVRSEATAGGECLVLEVSRETGAETAQEGQRPCEIEGLAESDPVAGFGLMICHRMAAQLGGSIEVQNPEEAAEVLRVRLPIEGVRSS